jgi:hypothetical protein
MIVLDLSILNQKGTPMFNSDLTANRPAAGIVGRIFIAIDSPYGIFRDTGTAWDQISSVGGGGGGNTIYTGDGTLTGTRTISSGGFQLIFNPQTTFFSSLTASTSASSFSVLGSNALSFAAGFSSSNIGNVYGANGAINAQNFLGNATFAQANLASAMVNVNKIDFGSGGHTITMTQSTAPGIRAMTGVQNQIQFTGSHNGTISHAAISQNLGFFRESGSTRTLTITNAYSLLINPLDDYGAGFTFTNRWGIYQAGASDANLFAGASTFSNSLSLTNNQNAITQIIVTNTTSGSNSSAGISLVSSNGSFAIAKESATKTAYKILSANDCSIYNSTISGDIAILNDFGTGKIKFAAGGSSTAQMTLASTGNLLIATTTDAGYKLDVNGTARVSGNTLIEKSQNAGTYLQVKNITAGTASSSYIEILCELGGGSISKYSSATNAYKAIKAGDFAIYNGTGGPSPIFGGNIIIFNDSSVGNINFAAGGVSTVQMTLTSSGSLLVGGTTESATAIVRLDSTTKGFLPPRMTNAQRTAIISPEVGLIVYCTDAVEGLYVYKSTGWTFII